MSEGQRGLKQLLGESFSLFRQDWKKFSVVTLSVYLPLEILTVAFFVLFGIEPGTKKITFSMEESLLRLLLALTSFAFYLLYQAAIIKAIESSDKKSGLSVSAIYREAVSLFWPLLGVVSRVILRIILWSFLLIVPGMIFGIFYSFSNMGFLLDGKKGYQALIFSKQVVKPYFWKFLGNTLVAVLVLLPIYIALSLILSLIFGAYNPEVPTFNTVIGLALQNVLSAVASVYLFIFFYLLYKELKTKQGGIA